MATPDAATSDLTDTGPGDSTPDPHRLPSTVLPSRYDVRIRPSLDDASFSGHVRIALDVQRPTSTVVLNAIELGIDSVSVNGADATWELDATTERMTVTTRDELTGAAELEIEFTGILNDKLRGFYRSTYTDDDGVEQVIATTQMQATDCRRAFPCWDEPAFKAVFGITLDIDDGLTAISNGSEIERSSTEGRTVIRFADTMVMSPYLVAFVVGRLEMTEPVDVDGIPLRVVHVPGKSALTGFGLDVGTFSLRWFQEYYGIPYPSDKVDLIALPDFAAGAMENLGCITFRESLLLVDPDTSTQSERQNVADVVAHELAHMWFGDLVTMRWWNGIWLNEAFATFMEIAACDAFAPEWERWTSFGLERSMAFEVDSLASTRPVEFEVRSPAEADGMFDVLTYQKGGALLRMLEQYLGAERFREGVSHYLRTHAHANTETNDLWDAIEATSGEPVRQMMDSWIWQPGYPLVTAEIATVDGEAVVELRQERFEFAGGDSADGGNGWMIPVHVRSGAETTTLLLEPERSVTTAPVSDTDAIIVNAGGHGFFRVAYGPELRARLADPEALAGLTTLERYCLVDDAWAATLAGRMSAVDLLDLLDVFADEREYGVWQAVVVALGGVSRLVEGDALDALRGRVRTLVRPALSDLGDPVAGESDLTRKLRGLLTRTAGSLGRDDEIIATCRDLFTRSLDGASVDAELLSAATAVVAASGDAADYDRMLDGVSSASTPQEQLRLLFALAEYDDEQLAARTCELAMSDSVKTQNAPFLLRAAIGNRGQGASSWQFVQEHWDEANARFPGNTIVRMVDSVKLLNTAEAVDDARRFFADHPIEQATQTLEQILERQRVNAALRERDGSALDRELLSGAAG
ncbi:M1 family metallopeptidase [Ilumatobacter nonamiensis]|uniref:M1 family metallopeptidase n=1 Tax=Ilumatobacter nonamiensis TaxID=467093 RepID=UPI00034A88AA|nr:M1 family metallopeptidase [Ilumatobacter nonamiensis]